MLQLCYIMRDCSRVLPGAQPEIRKGGIPTDG
jgi:hypothetical protein